MGSTALPFDHSPMGSCQIFFIEIITKTSREPDSARGTTIAEHSWQRTNTALYRLDNNNTANQVSIMMPPANQASDFDRSRNAGRIGLKDLPQGSKLVQTVASEPAASATAKAPTPPWRHPYFSCPDCSSGQINRIGRQSAWDFLLSVIYIYPFRCEACTRRFRLFEWGIRYHRQRRY